MPYLAAAVVMFGALSLLNLLLTVGILRRMRARTGGHPDPSFALGPGSSIGEFTAVTTADEPVSRDTLTGVVGFFSAGCGSCHDLLPRFVEHARDVGRDSVLAVLSGDDQEALSTLARVSRVVAADITGGPVARAFQNTWFPALYLVGEDHEIVATGNRIEELPVRPPAHAGARVRDRE